MDNARIKYLRSMVMLVAAGFLIAFVLVRIELRASATPIQSQGADQLFVDHTDIGGVVTSTNGFEAGVWIIAETSDLPTKFRKIVVSDEKGRYLLPDLPKASYKVWVRGYGLVDSEPVKATPGETVPLTAVVAPNPQAAAQYYPADYWYSLIQVPPKEDFPGTGAQGNGISPKMRSQPDWINQMKVGCEVCHQIGDRATRQIPEIIGTEFRSSIDAWDHRVRTGQDGGGMTSGMNNYGRARALAMYADWSDRIKAGEVPPAPPRPQGIERNLVLTLWDWGGPATFAHDELSTDKRRPTANAYGPIYGVDWGNDAFLMVDPRSNTASEMRVPVRDSGVPPAKAQEMPEPSPYWKDQLYWNDPANPNNMAMDSKGRVWIASRFRKQEDEPEFCKEGSHHPSAILSPQTKSFRQLSYYNPVTKHFTFVDTCFDTHHIQMATDGAETIYANGLRNGTIGWVKTRVLDETGNLEAAQGWCGSYVDVNGNGRFDEGIDKKVDLLGIYSIAPNPVDDSVWGAIPGVPGKIVRVEPKTCATEVYEPPFNNPKAPGKLGFSPRGIDIDSNGIVWTALAGSGHMASFDRRKCKILTGEPATDGQHCPEGWTLYPSPGPRFKGVTDQISADHHYYNWVDRFNTLGLGDNVPVANGTGSDSLLALLPSGKFVVLRVPYPLGFYSRGMDGRIDDPKAGWKGRGMYADYGPNANWHIEGGKGTRSALVKFQLRPNPLAR